jgi:hypothetical protein
MAIMAMYGAPPDLHRRLPRQSAHRHGPMMCTPRMASVFRVGEELHQPVGIAERARTALRTGRARLEATPHLQLLLGLAAQAISVQCRSPGMVLKLTCGFWPA